MLRDYYLKKLTCEKRDCYEKIVEGYLHRKDKIVLSSSISFSEVAEVLENIRHDHPEFVCFPREVVTNLSTFGKTTVCLPKYDEYLHEQCAKQARALASRVVGMETECAIRKIHNYFVQNVRYGYRDQRPDESHSAIGPLLYNLGVCEGIARAFQYVMMLAGIECTVIEGILDGVKHLWNVVSVDGYNYHIDVTSDIGATDRCWKKPSYCFYLVTDREMRLTHLFNEQFYCVQTKDNPFYKCDRVFFDRESIIEFFEGVPLLQRLVYFKYVGNCQKQELLELATKHLRPFPFAMTVRMVGKGNTYYIYR